MAKSIGAERASDRAAVDLLFSAKFSEALKTVGKQFDFVELFEDRLGFREKIVQVIGEDLNGYVLEDVAIDYLEQTPKKALDPSNIMDAEGIKKITELTAEQNVRTNILERDEELAIKKKNVETVEAMLELERQQKDAEARQLREVLSIQAREEAETKKVQEEERRKAEATVIQVHQDLSVQTETQKREVEVAEQNRLRAVAVEQEKVVRARDLEVVSREREVELQRIEAEKAIEVEKKEIANVIRETRGRRQDRRHRGRADQGGPRSLRGRPRQAGTGPRCGSPGRRREGQGSEGRRGPQEEAARHKAGEITVIAQAELEAAAKEADAKKKLAEGTQAEQAAPGLAEAKVQEAKADALEKEGTARSERHLGQGHSPGFCRTRDRPRWRHGHHRHRRSRRQGPA